MGQSKKVANYITKLRGLKQISPSHLRLECLSCKLYHKTTWFETALQLSSPSANEKLQIISQNYVVWNILAPVKNAIKRKLQIISQNYVVWNSILSVFIHCCNEVANYITKLHGLKLLSLVLCHLYFDKVANYITKLRGLKQCVANIT